ncbi:electron carrier [Coemansia nantahalensis]|uniref:Electron carrier n=2 Tax=Coemansia TaxID=4863 RepID=A0ACC1LA00_9FUNG|nr:electron carrier [Coemansia nantahalensis]KAJ2804010.1 electron carrier [Coemansia helicoidea]
MAEPGQTVLLVARAGAEAQNVEALQQHRDALVAQVGDTGKVDFEQIDRIEDGAAGLASAQYDHAVANPVGPWAVEHSSRALASLLLALKPSGSLVLSELVLEHPGAIDGVSATRTRDDLAQQLRFAGFVDVQITAHTQAAALADGRVSVVTATASKPAYHVGAAAALPFGKKAARKAWTINVESDDDAEIEDEDALLEEEDLARPDAASLARPGDAKPRRKPCKNCTCGLADGGEVDESEACKPESKPRKPTRPVDVVNVKSSCGNCSLGDAFRCTSCPYLGMPAFKPGEKVTLGGSMLHDDFMP